MTDINDGMPIVARTVQPLPGVVASYRGDLDPNIEWDVVPSAGDFNVGVDFAKGIMSVPLSGDDYSRWIQLRELVKLRITPTSNAVFKQAAKSWNSSGVTENLLNAAEQGRINHIARRFANTMDIAIDVDGSEKTLGKRLATTKNDHGWNQCVQFTLMNFGTKSFEQFNAGVRSVNSEWSKRLLKLNATLKSDYDSGIDHLGATERANYGDGVWGPSGFYNSVYAASHASDYVAGGDLAPKSIKEAIKKKEDEKANNYGDPTVEEILRGYDPGGSTLDVKDLPEDFEFDTDPNENTDDVFGPLIFNEELPLTVEVTGYMKRKRRPRQMGKSIAYPGRLLTDPERRIFGNKVKVKGGVIVFDISGSMNLSQSDIEAIVESAPAALILAYSDTGTPGVPNAHILANRGWRVSNFEDVQRSGNGVDGTALTWALRHKKHGEEVIWVSDGHVFGINGCRSNNLAIQCAKLIKKHRIIMIPSVSAAVKAFNSGLPLRRFNNPAGPIREALLGRYDS